MKEDQRTRRLCFQLDFLVPREQIIFSSQLLISRLKPKKHWGRVFQLIQGYFSPWQKCFSMCRGVPALEGVFQPLEGCYSPWQEYFSPRRGVAACTGVFDPMEGSYSPSKGVSPRLTSSLVSTGTSSPPRSDMEQLK